MRNLRCHLRTWLGGSLALALASSARAGEPREVWVELSDCPQPPYDASQLSRSLALELSPYRLQVHVHESAPADATRVRLLLSECDASADSLLLRWETPDGPPRHRALWLRDVPWPARARALALLISDVLRPPRWTDSETTVLTEPVLTEPARARSTTSLLPVTGDPLVDVVELHRSDPYSRPFSAYVTGALQASWVPRVSLLLYGLGLGLQGRWLESVEWAVEAGYSGGRGKLEGDLFEVDWWNAGVGLDYNLAAERRLQIGPRFLVAHVYGYSNGYADDFGESTAQIGGRIRLSPRLSTEAASLDLILDASYPLLTLGTRNAAEPVPWTAWVVTMGVGLSLEL